MKVLKFHRLPQGGKEAFRIKGNNDALREQDSIQAKGSFGEALALGGLRKKGWEHLALPDKSLENHKEERVKKEKGVHSQLG